MIEGLRGPPLRVPWRPHRLLHEGDIVAFARPVLNEELYDLFGWDLLEMIGDPPDPRLCLAESEHRRGMPDPDHRTYFAWDDVE